MTLRSTLILHVTRKNIYINERNLKRIDNYTIVALYPRVFQVSLFIFYHREERWLEILINIILMMSSLTKHLL